MIRPEEALPGRAEPMAVAEVHPVLGTPLVGPWPEVMKSFILRWDASGVPIASCGKFRACIQLRVATWAGGRRTRLMKRPARPEPGTPKS